MSELSPIPLFKPIGLSPLQAAQQYAQENGVGEVRLGYAGRLDPLAEGVLLMLAGDANALQTELLTLPKRYQCSAVFGVATDSYDLMGMPTFTKCTQWFETSYVTEQLHSFSGEYLQAYPPYSAVRVDGQPLFWWARQGRLSEIEIPQKMRTITDIRMLEVGTISAQELVGLAVNRVKLVRGDFRQKEIIEAWRQAKPDSERHYQTASFEFSCSSGTFARGLIYDLGQRIGCPATTLQLTRLAVGPYTIEDCYVLKK